MKNFDVLSINSRAEEKKKKGQKIINGSVGMLLNDDKTLVTYETVNKCIKNPDISFLKYGPSRGIGEFKEDVLKWIFEDSFKKLKLENISYAATLGGTNALYLLFEEYALRNAIVLYSDNCWQNYKNIIKASGISSSTYSRFTKDNSFDFVSLEKKFNDLTKKKTVLFLLNDPCHNPTGYSLSDNEYKKLFSLLNKYKEKVILLLDIAYLDFSSDKDRLINYILNNKKIKTYLAFSGSKCFGTYGGRIGAIFGFLSSKNDVQNEEEFFRQFARSSISSPNNFLIRTLHEVLKVDKNFKELKKEVLSKQKLLKLRSEYCIKTLDSMGIKHFKYSDGFFITLIVKNAYKLADYLEDNNIFLCPLDTNKIRIAISCLTNKEIETIIQTIKEFNN